ncbi:ParA family protein [Sulfitobacter sp. 1A13421]|uniref:ParA family protein n=1 Tax=Sulfitobacter sp. 1A13421 TaxID=3368595 RepID=UPI003744BA46
MADSNEGQGLVITFSQRKGGVGKTLTTLGLSTELAYRGYQVVVLDCEEKQTALPDFAEDYSRANYSVISGVKTDNIGKCVRKAKQEGADFVIIDTPGGMDTVAYKAIQFAHFCIIPASISYVDVAAVLDTHSDIVDAGETLPHDVPHALLWTKVDSQFPSKEMLEIEKQARHDGELDVFRTRIVRRNIFESMFSYSQDIYELAENSAVNKGRSKPQQIERFAENFRELADELLEKLAATGVISLTGDAA